MEKLREEIVAFLAKYAGKKTDEYDNEEYYTSPDAQELEVFAQCLEMGKSIKEIRFPHSSWGSGGYRPINSKEGEDRHNAILQEISKLQKENSK